MGFRLHQHVRVRFGRYAFAGVTGVICNAPESLCEMDQDTWLGPFKYQKRRKGTVIVYWVEFDEPADDGSGDGPYKAAGIEEEWLEPL